MTTTIQIGVNNDEENAQKQQQRQQLTNNRRSAFIPEEDDGKQFISKDESEFLRDSILRVNRPRISRPWFDQPSVPQNVNIKGSIRSNSSSGCSSNPQSSGPSSPISSKCSSENGTAEQQRKTTTMENRIGGNRTPAELKFEESPPKVLCASLVQKVAATNSNSLTIRSIPMTTTVNNLPSSSPSNAKIPFNSKTLLKRKEFPSQQRRVPMPPPQKNLLLPTQQQHQNVSENRFMPGARRIMDPAEEVEELSRAAQKQMAILEELEVEDHERKTRIVGNNNNNRANRECIRMEITAGDSPNSSRESTTTRLSSTSSAFSSASTAASPFVPENRRPSCSPSTSSASSSLISNEWSTGVVHSKYGEHKNKGMPQFPVEDITRRRQQLTKNVEEELQKTKRREKQISKIEMNKNGKNGNDWNSPRKLLECAGCSGMIQDVILQALGSSFHPACFRCSKCGKCLDGIPFAVEQGGTVICMEDYEQHFVPICHACHQPINAVNEFGQVVRVVIKDREFHIQCYSCEGCGMQLSNEEPSRCFPLKDHLLCRRCNTLWRRMDTFDSEAAISDL